MTTDNNHSPARRSLLAGLAAVPAAFALPKGALALSGSSAETLVEAAVGEINAIINSGKPENAMYGDFQRMLMKYADVRYIAFYSLGSAARSASKGQLNAYTQAYTGYISRKYGARFREFIGGEIKVQGTRKVKSWIEVDTLTKLRNQPPFDVTFLVSDKSGSPRFFNLFIVDVNMLLTERTEVGAMLDRRGGNIEALIKDLARA